MNPDHNYYVAHCIDEPAFNTGISKILNTCDHLENLMIGIYLIDEERFLYCNKIFEKIIGFTPYNLTKGGWDFWFSLIRPCEIAKVKDKLFGFFTTPQMQDAITIQYHVTNLEGEEMYIRHEILIYKLRKKLFALNYFFDVSEQEIIQRCVKDNGGNLTKNLHKDQCTQISCREEEVLKLIADGYSSKQIAEKLFISNHTAISHRKHLIQKFRVKNTAQLIKKASKVLEL